MANLKISQLTDGSPVQATDQFPINRGGANFRVSLLQPLNSTGGIGGFFSDGRTHPSGAITTGLWASSNNLVAFKLFTLAEPLAASRVSLRYGLGAASQFISVGIYSSDGNTLLIDSGPISATVTPGPTSVTATFTPVTLIPGVYIFTWTSTLNTINCPDFLNGVYGTVMNISGTNEGTAANASVAGQLPATLGALTKSNFSIPMVYFNLQ